MSFAESLALRMDEVLSIAMSSFISALSLKFLWNSNKKFKNIVELSYKECYLICLIIALIAN